MYDEEWSLSAAVVVVVVAVVAAAASAQTPAPGHDSPTGAESGGAAVQNQPRHAADVAEQDALGDAAAALVAEDHAGSDATAGAAETGRSDVFEHAEPF